MGQEIELRCDNGIKFGEIEGGMLEVKCKSRRCGASPSVVVLHKFELPSGKLLGTSKFRNPTAKGVGT